MAFLFVMPNQIDRIEDEKGAVTTLRVNCTELAPRNFNVNILNQPASVLQQFERFIAAKQPIMVPIKEGTTGNGIPFFKLEPGQILPVSMDYVKELQAQQPTTAASISTVNPVKHVEPVETKTVDDKIAADLRALGKR